MIIFKLLPLIQDVRLMLGIYLTSPIPSPELIDCLDELVLGGILRV